MITFRQFVENEFYPDNDGDEKPELQGSRNFMDRIQSGWSVGEGKYTGYEPHHQNHGYGSWTYVNMVNTQLEKEYKDFFEKQSISELKDVHFKWSEKKGFRLIRNAGGHLEEIKIKQPLNGKEITTSDLPDVMYDKNGNQTDNDEEAVDFEYFRADIEWT